jgi:hypothetical protein
MASTLGPTTDTLTDLQSARSSISQIFKTAGPRDFAVQLPGLGEEANLVGPSRARIRKVDTRGEEDSRITKVDEAMGFHAKFQQDEIRYRVG